MCKIIVNPYIQNYIVSICTEKKCAECRVGIHGNRKTITGRRYAESYWAHICYVQTVQMRYIEEICKTKLVPYALCEECVECENMICGRLER